MSERDYYLRVTNCYWGGGCMNCDDGHCCCVCHEKEAFNRIQGGDVVGGQIGAGDQT